MPGKLRPWPARAITDALRRAEQARGSARGPALETAVELIFSNLPGFRFLARDAKNATGSREVDLAYIHQSRETELHSFDDVFLIECKNWSKPVGADSIQWFVSKLRDANASVGLLVAADGVTGSGSGVTAAKAEIDHARIGEKPVYVLVVTPRELAGMQSADEVIQLLEMKHALLRAVGQFYEQLRPPPEPTQTVAAELPDKTIPGYNSHHLSVDRVASGWIDQPLLDRVRSPQNQVLVGAHGSGKTALLRMASKLPLAADFSDQCVMVLVAASSSRFGAWHTPSEVLEDFGWLARLALLETVEGLTEAFQASSDGLVAEITALWGAPVCSSKQLRRSIMGRASRVDQATPLDLFDSLRGAVGLANAWLGLGALPWAIAIDDADSIALLPDAILEGLGSSADVLFFKMTVSTAYRGAPWRVLTAVPFHDYEVISLDADYATAVAHQMLGDAVQTSSSSRKLPAADARIVADAIATDPGFSAWLGGEDSATARQAWRLRRVWPIVLARHAVLGRSGIRRSKSLKMYTSPESIMRLFGSTPRLASIFVSTIAESSSGQKTTTNELEKVIRLTLDRDFEVLQASDGPRRLLDAIGKYFSEGIYGDFRADPPMSFTVDQIVSDEVIQHLAFLLNFGYLVFADGPMRALGGIRGARLEMEARSFPRFGLPLIRGRGVRLSTILRPDVPLADNVTLLDLDED